MKLWQLDLTTLERGVTREMDEEQRLRLLTVFKAKL